MAIVTKIKLETEPGIYGTERDIGVSSFSNVYDGNPNNTLSEKINTIENKIDNLDSNKASKNHATVVGSEALSTGIASEGGWGHVRLSNDYKNKIIPSYPSNPGGYTISQNAAVNMYNELKNNSSFPPVGSNDAFIHNNIYRGIELLDSSDAPFNSLEEICNAICPPIDPFSGDRPASDFSNIYIGDTITFDSPRGAVNPKITWVVMGINTYLNRGTDKPHLVLVPKEIDPVFNAPIWNNDQALNDNNMLQGYLSSNIDRALNALVSPGYNNLPNYSPLSSFVDYASHKCGLLNWGEYLSNNINPTKNEVANRNRHQDYNPPGILYASLLSEAEVYGGIMLASNSYSLGSAMFQLPGFRLNPSLVNKSVTYNGTWYSTWWTATFCSCADAGNDLYSSKYSCINQNSCNPSDSKTAQGIIPKVLLSEYATVE